MDKWIEIFRTGRHTSSGGVKKNWTKADLDKIADSYAAGDHEAPVVIGHPKTNAPAYGWVDKVKRRGKVLLAKLKQVAPGFAELVEAGHYKKRSISLYPDGTLRHIGFLGAQPPAIKGLKDVAFSDHGAESFEFTEGEQQEEKMSDELKQKVAELERKLKQEADARKQAEKKLKEAGLAVKKKENRDFIEAGIKNGKILPAWKEQGLAEFMDALDEGETIEFSEGKKENPGQWFRNFLTSFAEHPLFKEMAPPEDKKKQADAEFAEAEKEAEEMAANYK